MGLENGSVAKVLALKVSQQEFDPWSVCIELDAGGASVIPSLLWGEGKAESSQETLM